MNESSIAVFIDFDNLALGVRDLKGEKNFKIELVLKRLLEKGRVVYKRAYSDWSKCRGDVVDYVLSTVYCRQVFKNLPVF